MKMGLPIAVCRVGYTVRAAFMNQILAQLASPAAIAGYAVYQQADDILCCLTIGIANTVAVLAGILLGEEDRPRMKTLLGTSVQATLRITLVVAVLMWFAAPASTSTTPRRSCTPSGLCAPTRWACRCTA